MADNQHFQYINKLPYFKVIYGKPKLWLKAYSSEMNITGTLPQAGNLKLFVPSLSTQGLTRPKQNICNVVLMRPDKTE